MSTSSRKAQRLKEASSKKEAGNDLLKRNLLLKADELYSEAVEVLAAHADASGMPCTKSGDDDEDQLLASCLSKRAQAVLDMADGKGILDDGTLFFAQFAGNEVFLQQFRRQALQQASECAQHACRTFADWESIHRLGLARFHLASLQGLHQMLQMSDQVRLMQEAGRCFKKSVDIEPSNAAGLEHLQLVRAWLAERGVTTLVPEYV
eukprot:NODE_20858_length_779_cov_2.688650.p1 GENE.NODE_20858_length_779_cov_2.688650~~NODE_20858_length_779_cov_2.688650.p1  ORF type:complete len:233 (-),score=66.21 NODE_20858_length_779_cov_2.688650:80-700(-)